MSRTLRWGVLSTAKIGRQKVIPAIQEAPSCDVVAIAGRDAARARAVADALGIDRSYGSYDELVADPQVDAVYVPLPNHMHAPWTIRAATAGKHVLCEKPIALSAAEAEVMVEACARAGVVLMEAFMYRLHPTWVAVRDAVESGQIGDLTSVQSWFSYFNDDAANIRNIQEYGGGALMDIGCYSVNLSRMLFRAEPHRVVASVTRDPGSGVDVLTSGILEFESGTATFTCSTRAEPDQRVHVYGSRGRIEVEIPFNIPTDRPTRIFVTAGGKPPTDPATRTITFDAADQYRIQAEQFARAVLDGTAVPVPPHDAVANMVVIDRLVASATDS